MTLKEILLDLSGAALPIELLWVVDLIAIVFVFVLLIHTVGFLASVFRRS
jgi:hypothetical protein